MDWPFLATSNVVKWMMRLSFRNMMLDLNIFNLWHQITDPFDELLDVNMIQGISSEYTEDEFFNKLDRFFYENIFVMTSRNSSTYATSAC